MKQMEIEKTKPTFIISVLKVDIIKVGLVFSISNFFITKTPLANNWRRKKIPSCSYLALLQKILKKGFYQGTYLFHYMIFCLFFQLSMAKSNKLGPWLPRIYSWQDANS